MASFTAIDKEKIDLLLKRALGFRYTTSSLIPGQENFQTSFILNEQIFSLFFIAFIKVFKGNIKFS